MKKLVVLFLVFLVNPHLFSQLPYLNASTGNAGEFPVDKDTNIYMFHGNRLVKTDKNFNTIWANTYGNLQFNHLLLSKTGSMFFIAGKSIGKIESNGTLTWCKDLNTIPAVLNGTANVTYTTSQINSLLLDRNDHLIITANTYSVSGCPPAYYLKLDTLGNPNKLAVFEGYLVKNFSIVNDSLGYYRFLGGGGFIGLSVSCDLGFTVFNDISNNFTSGIAYINSDTQYWESYKLMRSHFNSGFYVQISINYNYGTVFKNGILKCNMNGHINWGKAIDNCLPPAIQVLGYSRSIIEDNSGNLYLQVGRINSVGYPAYGVLKIDSNGVTNNTAIITHSFNASIPTPYFSVQKIAGDKLYIDFVSTGYPISPLRINMFNSSLSSGCYKASSCNSFGTGRAFTPIQTPTLQLVSSYSIASQNIASTTATFAANTGSCTLLTDVGLKENNLNKNLFNLFPNPANNKLNVISTSNAPISNIHILDVNGKVLKTFINEVELEIKDLESGIYFLNIQVESRNYHQKFIKQ